MKYSVLLLVNIYLLCTITSYGSSIAVLLTEQTEMLSEFKQELASINASASIEWKNNQEVQNLIEQIERSIQETSAEQQDLFKNHIKHMFQETGINIMFNQQNLIERLEETRLMKRNQISNISQPAQKQSLDNINYAPFTKNKHYHYYSYRPYKKKNIPYWKQKLSKKSSKRALLF